MKFLRIQMGGRTPRSAERTGALWLLSVAALYASASAAQSATFSDWQFRQEFQVSGPGLIKFSLPPNTLDAARADLVDLRLVDPAGNEVPYLVVRPAPSEKIVRPAKTFRVELARNTTLITLETGLERPLEGVTLATPDSNFFKPVAVAGSLDGKEWKPLASWQPVFRRPNGASQLFVAFPAGAWPHLRLEIDDHNLPVPFTGAEVHAASAEPSPAEPVPVQITERIEIPGETRLTLDLGAAHLRLASLEIESPDLLFYRSVTLAVRQVEENVIREKPLAQDTIYRAAVGNPKSAERLSVPLDLPAPNRELLLRIQNGDSPPLQITSVRGQRRPVYLIFLASEAGAFQIFTGNRLCPAPRYDLTSQGMNLRAAPLMALTLTPLAANPAYRPPETLPQVQDTGAPLEVSAWRFRKAVKIERAGVQQLELDLEALARAGPGFQDLRLLRDGRQLPYVIERTSILGSLKPEAARSDDPRQPKVSRWSLKLPQARLPVTQLTCTSSSPLFKRNVELYEEASDERGAKYHRGLGNASWVQSPDRTVNTFTLALLAAPITDTLFLETNNEDNTAIELASFKFAYPATRVLFKTASPENTWLFYGNPAAGAPQYDLSLVAGQLLNAAREVASLGPQEQLRKASWAEGRSAGQGGVLFWAVLGIVVVALLVLIARLVPRQPSPPS